MGFSSKNKYIPPTAESAVSDAIFSLSSRREYIVNRKRVSRKLTASRAEAPEPE
jgi:hypothetical protein